MQCKKKLIPAQEAEIFRYAPNDGVIGEAHRIRDERRGEPQGFPADVPDLFLRPGQTGILRFKLFEHVLRPGVALFGGFPKPHRGFGHVLSDASTAREERPDVVHRFDVSPFCSFPEPFRGFGHVLFDACAFAITDAEVELSVRVAQFGGLFERPCRGFKNLRIAGRFAFIGDFFSKKTEIRLFFSTKECIV